MAIEVGEGEDFEYNVEEAGSWSEEDAERITQYLFDRGGDVEGSDNYELIQKINEARGVQEGELDLATATIEQVKEYVGEDGDKAQSAFDAENAREKPRPTLLDWLTENFEVE